MTTKLHKKSVAAVKAWCKKRKITLNCAPRHIHPRSYVAGYAAPACLIVAECWADSEPQMQKFNKKNPLRTIRKFDPSLKAGDWCITAYISYGGVGEPIAIPVGGAA